jgi:integrase
MAKISVRYFTVRKRKDGSERYFWQPDKNLKGKGWKLTRLPPERNEALSQAEIINSQVDEWRAGIRKDPSTNLAGSIDAVIESYKKSRFYEKLSPRTVRDYDRALKTISAWAGDMPAAIITTKMVENLYEELRVKSKRTSVYVIQVLRIVFNHAEREGVIAKGSNPASAINLEYTAPKGILWTPEAVRIMVAAADEEGYFSIGTAIMLNEWLGQRKGDICSIKMADIVGGVLKIKQSKTGAEVELDLKILPAHIQARIEEQIRQNNARKKLGVVLIQQEAHAAAGHVVEGKPYSDSYFTRTLAALRKAAEKKHPELKGLIFKDLRHTAVTRLAEAGCTTPEIASITGHSLKTVESIIDRYLIRTAKMARNAFTKRAEAEKV